MNNNSKKILVTGAAGQLGSRIVQHLVGSGHEVYATDIVECEAQTEQDFCYLRADITKEHDVGELLATLPTINVIINNAGVGVFSDFFERTYEEFKFVFDVNCWAPIRLCQGLLPAMIKEKFGKIINVSSVYGLKSSDFRIYGKSRRNNSEVYSMSKAAIVILTKYLAAHFGQFGITANSISPGGIWRNQSKDFVDAYVNKVPSGRMADVEDMLPAIDFLVDDKNRYMNGENITIDGGFCAW